MAQVRVVLKSVYDDKGLKNAQKAFSGLSKSFGKIAGLAAAAFSVKALTDFTRAAVEDAKSQALLADQLRNTVGANDELIASVEQSISKMQMEAAVADDVLRPALGQLVRATGNVADATRLMDIALDVSAATGRDVNAVAIALSRAYQGNTTALSRLGIKAEEGVDVFAMLEEQFAGAAETAARNDPFQRLTIIFGELQEQIGQYFIPLLNNVADYFASAEFGKAFEDLSIKVGLAMDAINRLFLQISGQNAMTFFINVLAGVAYEVTKLTFLFDALGKSAGYWVTGQWAKAVQFNPAEYIKNQIKQLDLAIAASKMANAIRTTTGGFTGAGGGGGGGGGGGRDTAADRRRKAAQEAARKAAEEQRKALADARKLIDDANSQLVELQTELSSTLAQINADYAKELASVNKDFANRLNDIVKQSQDRLRDAYRSVVSVSISDLFGERTTQKVKTEVSKLVGNIRTTITRETEETVGGSVNDLVAGLTKRLTDSKTLLENASLLASRGFSQTFIEQVVGAGTETGNELAKAILEATPETQDELRNLFLAVESQANNGMDALAKSIYDKAGLATQELKDLYTATQQEQVDALLALQQELNKNLTEANNAFQKSVADLRAKLKEDLEAIKGDLTSLKLEIDSLMAKLAELAGLQVNAPAVNIPGPVIPKVPATTQKPTVINNNTFITKTDPTKSAAETGKQVAKVVNRYTGGGGGLNRGFIAL
jgi:DNA-directed RNA polymerase subunit F